MSRIEGRLNKGALTSVGLLSAAGNQDSSIALCDNLSTGSSKSQLEGQFGWTREERVECVKKDMSFGPREATERNESSSETSSCPSIALSAQVSVNSPPSIAKLGPKLYLPSV